MPNLPSLMKKILKCAINMKILFNFIKFKCHSTLSNTIIKDVWNAHPQPKL